MKPRSTVCLLGPEPPRRLAVMSKLTVFNDHVGPLEAVLKAAREAGATDAEASISSSEGLNVGTRLGKLEQCEQAESGGLSLHVFVGQRSASVTGTWAP